MAALKLVDAMITKIDDEDMKNNQDSNELRFTFGYWNICGYGAPARMMLVYSNCKYKNIMYDARNDWYDIKFKMNLDFPNLPYLIDHKNNIRFTESTAIYAYLGRQLNIGIKSDPQQMYNEMVIGVIKDVWSKFSQLCYRDYPAGKEKYLKEILPPKLKLMENWVQKDSKKWLTGDTIAVCDFITYYLLFANIKMDPSILDKSLYPQLARFYHDFDTLPFMDKYRELGYAKLPLNGASANFR